MRRCLLALCLLFSAPAAIAQGTVRVEIKDPKGAPVADAVASLTPLDRAPTVQAPTEPIEIRQKNLEFEPYVTAVVVGTQAMFPNVDDVQHHVYSQSKTKRFDIPLHKKEAIKPVLFDKPGVVSLGCNIHDWMSAYVIVLATPHFAKSGDDGQVPLNNLPAGRYRLEVWHPRVREMLTREVTVAANDPATQVVAVTLGADRRIRRAPEGGAGTYK